MAGVGVAGAAPVPWLFRKLAVHKPQPGDVRERCGLPGAENGRQQSVSPCAENNDCARGVPLRDILCGMLMLVMTVMASREKECGACRPLRPIAGVWPARG